MSIPSSDYPSVKGLNIEGALLFPNSTEKVTNTIPSGASVVVVGANVNGTDDFIILPGLATVNIGHVITVICNAAGMEIRTPASSGEKINNTDSDGTQEYTVPSGSQIHYFTKISNSIGWEGHGYTAIGAVIAAITPDA
jgi:hypothetical protein